MAMDANGLKTYCGENIVCNNVTAAAVMVEYMKSGEDPLQGTGLSYGRDLVYDVSPDPRSNPELGVTAPSPEGMGTPAKPNDEPFSPGNPYPGMGSF